MVIQIIVLLLIIVGIVTFWWLIKSWEGEKNLTYERHWIALVGSVIILVIMILKILGIF